MQHTNAAAPARSGERRSYGRTAASRAERTPHPMGRLYGLPDSGDMAVNDAVAAARAREQAARDKLTAKRDAAARLAELQARKGGAPFHQTPRGNGPTPRVERPLTKQERRLAVLMMSQPWPSLYVLADAFYGVETGFKERNIISAVICQVRDKLARHGVSIPSRTRGAGGPIEQLVLPAPVLSALGFEARGR